MGEGLEVDLHAFTHSRIHAFTPSGSRTPCFARLHSRLRHRRPAGSRISAGFTALTGETGAGKSILIDALALVLGERSDASLVRDGCTRAEINAEFCARCVARPGVAGGQRSVRRARRLPAAASAGGGGRSRAYVNGRPSTLQQLKELGEKLVDIHGQHEHQSLLRPARSGATGRFRRQSHLLPKSREPGALAAAHPPAAGTGKDGRSGRARAAGMASAGAYAARFPNRNGKSYRPTMAVWRMRRAHRGRRAVDGNAVRRRNGGARRVNGVISRLQAARDTTPAEGEPRRTRARAIQIQEAVYSLRHYRQRLELDPQRLHEVEQRIEAIHSTSRKYRVAAELYPSCCDESTQTACSGGTLSTDGIERKGKQAAAMSIWCSHTS